MCMSMGSSPPPLQMPIQVPMPVPIMRPDPMAAPTMPMSPPEFNPQSKPAIPAQRRKKVAGGSGKKKFIIPFNSGGPGGTANY